jgi:hypothetical protein
MWMNPPAQRGSQAPPRDPEAERRAAEASVSILAVAALAVLWPAAVVFAAVLATAWLTGAHPVRVLTAALRSTPLIAGWMVLATAQNRPWEPGHVRAWLTAPYTDWKAATLPMLHGHPDPAAMLLMVPLAIPAGTALAAAAWAYRVHQMRDGLAGQNPLSPAKWDERQWRHQARTARWEASRAEQAPIATPEGVTVGPVIRTVRARWTQNLIIPLADFSRHMAIVGASGSGKTTLMIRLWCGWYAAALRAHQDHHRPRPLLIVLDGKGGPDSRNVAARTIAALRQAGARHIGLWPDVPLNMWDLPPATLAVLLHQLIQHGDSGGAAYYADTSQGIIRLAVLAPQGPPRSPAELLQRLSPAWLEKAYEHADPATAEQARAARPRVPDVATRYRVLMDRLGDSLSGHNHFTDADAWYCILEGTAEPSVAEAQAAALIELAARAAVSGPPRQILLAADDYSAVSQKVPLSNLYERGRSLGIGIQVSAQSWEGLGPDTDERKRITSTADGGVWLLRAPDPEQLVNLAGTRLVLSGGRKMLGPSTYGDEGTARVTHAYIADPNRIRQLDTGQAALIRHGTSTYVHVIPATAP